MSYVVVKTIKKRRYRYLQRSYRVGKKVRTMSLYLGPEDGPPRRERRYGLPDEETMLAQLNAREERDAAARQAHLDKLHADFGLRIGPSNPAPVEKAVSSPTASQPSEQSPADAPAKAP